MNPLRHRYSLAQLQTIYDFTGNWTDFKRCLAFIDALPEPITQFEPAIERAMDAQSDWRALAREI